MSKLLKWIFRIVLAVLFISGIFLYTQYKSSSLDYSAEEMLPVKDKVDVYFDDIGVPHIYSENAEDAYFTLGYIVSSERYFQADMMRRIGKGRLAEVFGEKLIETDKLFRTLGIEEHSLSSIEAIEKNEDYFKLAKEYLRGFNYAMENTNEPLEYKILGIKREKLDFSDLMAISAYMAFNFDKGLKNDPFMNSYWQELGEEYMSDFNPNNFQILKDSLLNNSEIVFSLDTITSIFDKLPSAPFLGSNAWVVSPEKSKSAKVLFSNDTHIRNSQPATWYEAHMEYPGFSFYGNYLPGIPFALIGHTRQHAWGLTMLQNDDTDLFKEHFDSKTDKYYHHGEWKEFETRKEIIRVKDAEDVILEIKESVHGPLVNDIIKVKYEQPLSMHWSYSKFPNNLLEVFHELAYSKNINDVENAASKIASPGLNMAYGDIDGNIALWACAKLIKRDSTYSQLILPGTGEFDIEEYYDFSLNPQYKNPASGFIYTANQNHGEFKGIQHQGYFASMDRANAIRRFLSDREKISISDLQELAFLDVNKEDDELCDFLVQHIDPKGFSQLELSALNILNNWEGKYNIQNKGPLVFQNFKYYLLKNVFEDEIGEENYKEFISKGDVKKGIDKILRNFNNLWWKNSNDNQSPGNIITSSFKEAIENIINKKGSDISEWQWGNCHFSYFGHPLGTVKPLDKIFDIGPFPCPGSPKTVNAQSFSMNESCNYKVFSGPQMRIMIDFSDVEDAESILPVGQSGNPSSEFYSNQAEDFVSGKYRAMLMKKEEIQSGGRKIAIRPHK